MSHLNFHGYSTMVSPPNYVIFEAVSVDTQNYLEIIECYPQLSDECSIQCSS